MTKNIYKSIRIVDGKPRTVIVDENGKITNRNPSKEELKLLTTEIQVPYSRGNIKSYKPIYYNETNSCDRCGRRFDNYPCKEYNIEGEWTKKWLCNSCYKADYRLEIGINVSSRRSKLCNLGQYSNQAMGDLFEELTCRWRSTISTVPVENLNKKYDCYNTPIDHSRDSEFGIIQTRGRLLYISYYQSWTFAHLERDHFKEFDVMICYCANKKGDIIERIYIFPIEEIFKRRGITITKYGKTGKLFNGGWYEQYRIKDDKILENVNKIWREINGIYNCGNRY